MNGYSLTSCKSRLKTEWTKTMGVLGHGKDEQDNCNFDAAYPDSILVQLIPTKYLHDT